MQKAPECCLAHKQTINVVNAIVDNVMYMYVMKFYVNFTCIYVVLQVRACKSFFIVSIGQNIFSGAIVSCGRTISSVTDVCAFKKLRNHASAMVFFQPYVGHS